MKLIILLLNIICVSYAYAGKLDFDSKYPLYLSDGSRFSFSQMEAAFDKAYSYNKPVILFVHGRGNEPKKSLEGGTFVEGNAIHKLEEQYGARVVMFNWQSSAFLYDRTKPLSHMKESAASFKKVLVKVKSYLKENDKKMSLLAHSMGSIVLQTYLQNYGWEPKSKIFSSVLFSSPDADNKDHVKWLDKVASFERVYVTINQHDDILEKSTDERSKNVYALGLVPIPVFSTKATYLDLTKVGSEPGKETGMHEVFNKTNMKNQKYLCEVLDSILTSKTPQVEGALVATAVPSYFKFKFKLDSKSECFDY